MNDVTDVGWELASKTPFGISDAINLEGTVASIILFTLHPSKRIQMIRRQRCERDIAPPDNKLFVAQLSYLHITKLYLLVFTIKPRLCFYAVTNLPHRLQPSPEYQTENKNESRHNSKTAMLAIEI